MLVFSSSGLVKNREDKQRYLLRPLFMSFVLHERPFFLDAFTMAAEADRQKEEEGARS